MIYLPFSYNFPISKCCCDCYVWVVDERLNPVRTCRSQHGCRWLRFSSFDNFVCPASRRWDFLELWKQARFSIVRFFRLLLMKTFFCWRIGVGKIYDEGGMLRIGRRKRQRWLQFSSVQPIRGTHRRVLCQPLSWFILQVRFLLNFFSSERFQNSNF